MSPTHHMLFHSDQCITSPVSSLPPCLLSSPKRGLLRPSRSSVKRTGFSRILNTVLKIPLNIFSSGDEEFLQIHIFHIPESPLSCFSASRPSPLLSPSPADSTLAVGLTFWGQAMLSCLPPPTPLAQSFLQLEQWGAGQSKFNVPGVLLQKS